MNWKCVHMVSHSFVVTSTPSLKCIQSSTEAISAAVNESATA